MSDKFVKWFSSYEGPATDAFAITPSDSTVFTQPSRSLYIGGAGNITVQMAAASNTIVTFAALNAGTMIPIRVTKVFANSTATLVVGLF